MGSATGEKCGDLSTPPPSKKKKKKKKIQSQEIFVKTVFSHQNMNKISLDFDYIVSYRKVFMFNGIFCFYKVPLAVLFS